LATAIESRSRSRQNEQERQEPCRQGADQYLIPCQQHRGKETEYGQGEKKPDVVYVK